MEQCSTAAFRKILEDEGRLTHFDVMVSRNVQPPEGGWLGLFLGAALRHGHTAVDVGPCLLPSIGTVFTATDTEPLGKEISSFIEQHIREEAEKNRGNLIVCGTHIAIPHIYAVEQQLAKEIFRLSHAPQVGIDEKHVRDFLKEYSLNEEQLSAVLKIFSHSFSIITGGPGTGKTYVAGVWLACAATPGLRVGLLAPTGRAVQNLSASIASSLKNPLPHVEAMTIHRAVMGKNPLAYNVLIIDECSMVDSQLLAKLFCKTPTGTRIILLGDQKQLPPIEPGQPFYDLLETPLSSISISHLHNCHRTASQGLRRFASLITQQDINALSQWDTSEEDISFLPYSAETFWKTFDSLMTKHPAMGRKTPSDFSSHMIVSPEKQGLFGTDAINAYIGQNTKGAKYQPVVICKNNYDLDVMNGDLGLLENLQPLPLIHFPKRSIPAILCPRYEPAYAVTVHKSQGSEFHTVCCVIPKKGEYDRRMLYTAVTRARSRLVFLGSPESMATAISRQESRVTLLKTHLQEERLLAKCGSPTTTL